MASVKSKRTSGTEVPVPDVPLGELADGLEDSCPCARCDAPVAVSRYTSALLANVNRLLESRGDAPLGSDAAVLCQPCSVAWSEERGAEARAQSAWEDSVFKLYTETVVRDGEDAATKRIKASERVLANDALLERLRGWLRSHRLKTKKTTQQAY